MRADENSQDLVLQTKDRSIERQALVAAGRAANRAAADYLFADYRQRRAERTLRTQRAALVLWVQYLVEVGAAAELLALAERLGAELWTGDKRLVQAVQGEFSWVRLLTP